MFKSLINSTRNLALLGLTVMLMGAILIAPRSAAAASCRPSGTGPEACVAVEVHVYDAVTGIQLNNAKVVLRDAEGNVTYAYLMNERGIYLANVTPGEYKVSAYAPAHNAYADRILVQPQPTAVYAPLMPNTFSPTGPAPTASSANY